MRISRAVSSGGSGRGAAAVVTVRSTAVVRTVRSPAAISSAAATATTTSAVLAETSGTAAKYILDAVMFVADHGPSFLPLYHANIVTGEWTSIVCPVSMDNRTSARRTLAEVNYGFSDEADAAPPRTPEKSAAASSTASAAGGEAAMFAKLTEEALRLASGVASVFGTGSEMPKIAENAAAPNKNKACAIVDLNEPLRKQPTASRVTKVAGLSERDRKVAAPKSPVAPVVVPLLQLDAATPSTQDGANDSTLVASNEYGEYDLGALALYGHDMLVEPCKETIITATLPAGSPLTGESSGMSFKWQLTVTSEGHGGSSVVTTVALAEKQVVISCKYVRPELRDLTTADSTTFFSAMRELYTVELEEGREKYGGDFANSAIMAGYHSWGDSKKSVDMFGSACGSPRKGYQISEGWFADAKTIYDPDETFLGEAQRKAILPLSRCFRVYHLGSYIAVLACGGLRYKICHEQRWQNAWPADLRGSARDGSIQWPSSCRQRAALLLGGGAAESSLLWRHVCKLVRRKPLLVLLLPGANSRTNSSIHCTVPGAYSRTNPSIHCTVPGAYSSIPDNIAAAMVADATGGFAGPGSLTVSPAGTIELEQADAGSVVLSGVFVRDDGTGLPSSASAFVYIDIPGEPDDFTRGQATLIPSTGAFSTTVVGVPAGNSRLFLSFVVVDPAEALDPSGADTVFALDVSNDACDPSLRFTLEWFDDSSDVDLHVIEPGGNEVFYGAPEGLVGSLDVDDVDGFGPENYILRSELDPTVVLGEFEVFVVLFNRHSATPPVTWRLTARVSGEVAWVMEGDLSNNSEQSATFALSLSDYDPRCGAVTTFCGVEYTCATATDTVLPDARVTHANFVSPRLLFCALDPDGPFLSIYSGAYSSSDYTGSDYASSDYASSDYASSDYASSDYASSDYASSDYAGSHDAGSDYAGSDYASYDASSHDAGSEHASSDASSDYPRSDHTSSNAGSHYPRSDHTRSHGSSDHSRSNHTRSDASSDYPRSDYASSDRTRSDYARSDARSDCTNSVNGRSYHGRSCYGLAHNDSSDYVSFHHDSSYHGCSGNGRSHHGRSDHDRYYNSRSRNGRTYHSRHGSAYRNTANLPSLSRSTHSGSQPRAHARTHPRANARTPYLDIFTPHGSSYSRRAILAP
eukprot:g2502.t3